MRFLDQLLRQMTVDLGVVAVSQRLRQHSQRTHRRLQLVADIGHEVSAHCIQPGPLAEVIDNGHRSSAIQRDRTNEEHPRWRAEQLQPLLSRFPGDGCSQESLDRFVDEHITVTADCCGTIAKDGCTLRIGQHDAGRHCVEACGKALDFTLRRFPPGLFLLQLALSAIGFSTAESAHESSDTSRGAGTNKLPVSSTPTRSGLRWSGTQPVTTKRTRSAMFTA